MTTDARPPGPSPAASSAAPRARVRKPAPGWVFGGALGTFFAALSLLAVQVRAGEDPALGEAKPVAAVDERPRKVIVKRKVIKRIVIHHPRREAAAPSSSAAPVASAPATASAPSAPAPAVPAPAPAPAPAPLTTQSS